jgi:hypothetical protein
MMILARRTCSTLRTRRPSVAEEGGVDVEGRCTAFAAAGCSFDGAFLVGTLDGACSCNFSHGQDRVSTTIATK